MLNDTFAMRERGGSGLELARARGYADGYLRCLSDAGIATQEELLKLIAEARSQTNGPAIGEYARLDAAYSG
jgi:hypothetical protein